MVLLFFLGLYTNPDISPFTCFLVYLFFAACFAWVIAALIPADVTSVLPKKKMKQATRRVLAAVRLGAFGGTTAASPFGKPKAGMGSLLAGLQGTKSLQEGEAPSVDGTLHHASTTPAPLPSLKSASPPVAKKGLKLANSKPSIVVITLKSQATDPSFLAFTVFFALQFLLSEFWLTTCNEQLLLKRSGEWFGRRASDQYSKWFVLINGLMFALAPVLGLLVERVGSAALFAVMNCLFIVHNATLLGGGLYVQILGFVAYGIARTALFMALVAHLRARFGFLHFRWLSAIVMLVAGCFSLVQLGLAKLGIDGAGADGKDDFDGINAYFIAQSAVTMALIPVMTKKRPDQPAQGARRESKAAPGALHVPSSQPPALVILKQDIQKVMIKKKM